MSAYLLRRLLTTVPLLIGINLLTFVLFFVINSPEDMARMHLGQKHVTQEGIAKWTHERGYDLPLFYNGEAEGLQATHGAFLGDCGPFVDRGSVDGYLFGLVAGLF